METTYVCTAPLHINKLANTNYDFKSSVVYKKLQHVLWVPIIIPDLKNDTINNNFNNNFNNRIIGNAFLWQPNSQQLDLLATDWLELTEMLLMGQVEKLTSHYGQVLQIRPKAANSKVISRAIGPDGAQITTLPRGFYLRKKFTREIYLTKAQAVLF